MFSKLKRDIIEAQKIIIIDTDDITAFILFLNYIYIIE